MTRSTNGSLDPKPPARPFRPNTLRSRVCGWQQTGVDFFPGGPMSVSLPPVADQARVFRRLRVRLFRNALREALEHGRLRLVTMVLSSLLVAAFTFGLGVYLFDQLVTANIPLRG